MVKSILMVVMLFACTWLVPAEGRTASPADYGKVILNSASQKEGLAPVGFDHWLHRSKYTCRLCHVDIGFVMKANATGIKAADNMKGVYCGVCHNGKMQFAGKAVFAACSTDKSDMKRCERCHSEGKNVKKEYEFKVFTAKFPKDKMGNEVNWEKAASDGLIQPLDYIEGVSIKRMQKAIEKDFVIQPKSKGVDEIIFSHRKHSVWNGCEVCHPEIFIGGKKGSTKYTMQDLNDGKFCAVCHASVAFPLPECDRCHSKKVN